MTRLDAVIIKYLEHYAQYAAHDVISSILARGVVESDVEARALTDVIDAMYAHLDDDVKSHLIVYRQAIQAYDVDKVAETVVAWLEEAGYEHVTSARGY